MPTYQYCCEDCHLTFECHVAVKDRDSVICCLCDGQVVRSVGCAGFQLKGERWEKDSYGGVPPTEVDLNE